MARKFMIDTTALATSKVFQLAANFLILPILARLISPEDYGLATIALSIAILGTVFSDAGLGSSLVRLSSTDRAVWSSVFWVSVLWSFLLAFAIFSLSGPISAVLGDRRAAPLIAVLAIAPFLTGALSVPIAELQRRNQYLTIATAETICLAVGFSVGVYSAFRGAGAWALVLQSTTALITRAIIICARTKFRPTLTFRQELVADHLRFARDTAGWALVSYLTTQAANIVIGRVLGPGRLGFFAMANRIQALPGGVLGGPVQTALYSRMVRFHDDSPKLHRVILTGTAAMALVIFPPMALLASAAPSAVTIVFSQKWIDVAPVLTILAPLGALQAVTGLNGPVLMAVGRTDSRFKLSLEFALLWMAALLFSVKFGIIAVAAAYTGTFLLYSPRLLYLFLDAVALPIRAYLRVFFRPVAIALLAVLTHLGLVHALHLSNWQNLFLAAFLCVAAWAIGAAMSYRELRASLASF